MGTLRVVLVSEVWGGSHVLGRDTPDEDSGTGVKVVSGHLRPCAIPKDLPFTIRDVEGSLGPREVGTGVWGAVDPFTMPKAGVDLETSLLKDESRESLGDLFWVLRVLGTSSHPRSSLHLLTPTKPLPGDEPSRSLVFPLKDTYFSDVKLRSSVTSFFFFFVHICLPYLCVCIYVYVCV